MVKPKRKHPDEMTNGEFTTEGGLEVYKLLWGLQGRLGRAEASIAFLTATQVAILGRVFGAW